MTAKGIASRIRRAGLYSLAAVILIAGCHTDISGAYIASDKSGVCWLQLVRTPDSHLTGQLSASMLKPDGTIEQSSVSVTGAIGGENVTLSGHGFLGLDTLNLAGTLSGDTLTLSGSQPIPVTFKRAALSDYQAQVASLNARSQSILHEKAATQTQQRVFQVQANFISQVDRLIGHMEQFDPEADVHLGRFPGTEKTYEALTTKVEGYVSSERQLYGNPNASVTRGQLSVAANQVEIETEQVHNQGQALETSLDVHVKPIADQAAADERDCHTISENSGALTPSELQNVKAACEQLENALVPFRQKYGAMTAGLTHLEQVYQREKNTQEGLIQESQRLQ